MAQGQEKSTIARQWLRHWRLRRMQGACWGVGVAVNTIGALEDKVLNPRSGK